MGLARPPLPHQVPVPHLSRPLPLLWAAHRLPLALQRQERWVQARAVLLALLLALLPGLSAVLQQGALALLWVSPARQAVVLVLLLLLLRLAISV